ncbi:MAG: 50S ribosomal protein L22 [Nitrospinaceae bacterium]
MEVKAILRHTRTAPRKARLVAGLIRGKNVNEAMNILTFTHKRVAQAFQKLLKSAIANAEENHKVLDVDDLFVKNICVDEGVTWKRNMPRARGMATMIRKRTSHITLVLDEKQIPEK